MEITILHCKCSFGTMRMPLITLLDLDLYQVADQRQNLDLKKKKVYLNNLKLNLINYF